MLQTKAEIDNWLFKMRVVNYVINDDLTVDVNGSVILSKKELKEIPVQFGIVNGDFYIMSNYNLTSLKGSPSKVKGHFIFFNTDVKSLKYAPKEVSGTFSCNGNIKSLEDGPDLVGHFILVSNYENQLRSLHGCKTKITKGFSHRCARPDYFIKEIEKYYTIPTGDDYDPTNKYEARLSPKQFDLLFLSDELRLELSKDKHKVEKKIKI